MTISTLINIGSVANDGTGDDLRTAFYKVNQNFANVIAANVGIIGYINQGNTIQSQQIEAANVGIIGYINQGNTIQSQQIEDANIGMRGYVDSVSTLSSYGNANVASYLTSYLPTYVGNIGNLTVNSNLISTSITVDSGTFRNVRVTGNIFGKTNGHSLGFRDIPQLILGTSDVDQVLGDSHRGHHVLTTPTTLANIYITDSIVGDWFIGSTVLIINHGTGNANIIANSSVSLYMAGNSITGANARTLLSRGVATLTNISANVWYIYGTSIV